MIKSAASADSQMNKMQESTQMRPSTDDGWRVMDRPCISVIREPALAADLIMILIFGDLEVNWQPKCLDLQQGQHTGAE